MGASSDEKKIGGRPIFYLKHYNFEGEIYPINPNYDVIQGLKAYKSLTDVPGDVDLALIALPSAMVEDAVRACADKGVTATVSFSSGFAETGDGGAKPQARLLEIARDAGMRAVLLDRFGRENHGDELSAEGARWREAGAPVVHDLSDVLEHVARSDFALGCHE